MALAVGHAVYERQSSNGRRPVGLGEHITAAARYAR